MAWFRRKRDDAPDVDEPAPADADAGDVVRATRSQAGDWMAMPPIHTTVGPPPSTFKVQRVSEIMTTRRPMAFMGQLGHQVSSSAPSGHVEGLTTTVAPPTAAPHPIDLPLHGRTPHHEDEHADAPTISPSAAAPVQTEPTGPPDVPAAPAVQRSVRDLAPGQPVTAQTLGLMSPAAPVVQRELHAAPTPAPPPSRSVMPEPVPTRVLREPTRPPTALETRAPAVTVVDAGTPAPPDSQAGAAAPELPSGTINEDGFLVPDQPVEVSTHAAAPAVAPLAGDVPLQRSAAGVTSDVATEDAGVGDAPGAAAVDLPLAAPPTAPAGAEMMPPIQPRAIQRQAVEASARQVQREAEPRDENGLPPLPSWAREQLAAGAGADAADATVAPPAVTASSMPLHAPSTVGPSTIQREAAEEEHFDGDGHDHGAPVQREATGDAGDESADPGSADAALTAPLVGSSPIGTSIAAGQDAEDAEDELGDGPAGIDMPLQAPAGGPSIQREVSAAADDAGTATGDDGPEPVDEPGPIAPLLGDRPLQLQRVAAGTVVDPALPSDAPSHAMPLPLVADVASGPALDAGPTPPATGPSAAATSAPLRTLATSPVASTSGTSSVQRSSVATPASPAAAPPPLRALASAPSPAGVTTIDAPFGGFAGDEASGSVGDMTLARVSEPATPDLPVQTARDGASPAAMPLQQPGRPAEAPASVGDLAVAAGVAQRMADGSVVFSGGAGSAHGTSIPLQRDALPGGFFEPATPVTFAVQREETASSPAPPTTDDAAEDKSSDELADRLYDRIRWKLTADLRADEWRTNAVHWNRKGR